MTENGLIFKLTKSSSLDGSTLSRMNHCLVMIAIPIVLYFRSLKANIKPITEKAIFES